MYGFTGSGYFSISLSIASFRGFIHSPCERGGRSSTQLPWIMLSRRTARDAIALVICDSPLSGSMSSPSQNETMWRNTAS